MPFVFQPEMRLAAPVSLDALRLLDEVELDVVHAHDPFAIGLFGLRVARRHKIPYVHTYHTLYPEYVHYVWETRLTKRLAERLSREYCEACDSIVAPSSKIEDYLREWGVKRAIEIIATGVDVDEVLGGRRGAHSRAAPQAPPEARRPGRAVRGSPRPREERRGAHTRLLALSLRRTPSSSSAETVRTARSSRTSSTSSRSRTA